MTRQLPQKLGPRHLDQPPVDRPSQDVVSSNQILQDGGLTLPLTPSSSRQNLYRLSSRDSARVLIHAQKNVPTMFGSVPPAGSAAYVQKVVLWIFSCPAIITTLPAK